jgi:hypothetical protein
MEAVAFTHDLTRLYDIGTGEEFTNYLKPDGKS